MAEINVVRGPNPVLRWIDLLNPAVSARYKLVHRILYVYVINNSTVLTGHSGLLPVRDVGRFRLE